MHPPLLSQVDEGALRGKHVLVRLDFNVPLGPASEVSDDTRIRAALPTLSRLREAGARSVLISHLGRPAGAPDPALSLAPVARKLSEVIEAEVPFVPELVGERVEGAVSRLEDGEMLLLENTRFHPGETTDDPGLGARLAGFAELFVQDAFGAVHRAHASTHATPLKVRERGHPAVAGLLLERELRFLADALEDPRRPFHAVLGGAKISGKIEVIEALLPRVDRLLVGGAMANTFVAALGLEIGDSLVESDRLEVAREILARAGERLLLPVDFLVAPQLSADADPQPVERDSIPAGEKVGDIGPASLELFARELSKARTVVWNGPMGVFELPPFAGGTLQLARAAAEAAAGGTTVVLGGGDSAAAAAMAGVTERLTHVSTGGGASLELLAGRTLPGVAALGPGMEVSDV